MQAATDFGIYFGIIWKRLWLIALLFLVTVGVIFSLTYTSKPVYRSTARLQVLMTDRADVSLFSTYRSSGTTDEISQAQNDFMRSLKSGFVAWKTIADLNLEIGALDLLKGLSTAVEGDFIIVTVESDDPGRAESIATTQVNNALAYYREMRATPSRVLLEFVSGLLEPERQKMLDAEAALLKFKQDHSIDSISQETQALQDLIRNLKLERERAAIEEKRADTLAQTYRAEQKRLEDKANELRATAEAGGTESPSTEQFYRDQANQHGATALNYEAQRDGYAASLKLYDETIEARSEELRGLLKLYSEYNTLERELTRATNNYNFLRDKENEARLKQLQAENLGYIQIVEPARKPDAPVPSKLPQLLMVGGIVSILAGFVLSFLLEFMNSLRKVARKQPASSEA